MTLTVIILQHGRGQMTRCAVESFREHCGQPHEIFVVDNASPNEADRSSISCLEGVHPILLDRNLGFGAANNLAAERGSGDLLLFLNNDTITREDFAGTVIEAFHADPSVGIVGPRLLNEDGTPQLSCGKLPWLGREAIDRVLYRQSGSRTRLGLWHARRSSTRRRYVGWVTGAALFIRAELFRQLGGFDKTMFMYFEDKDLCARTLQAGYSVLFLPETSVIHLLGASARDKLAGELRATYRASQRVYYKRHRGRLEQLLLRLYQWIFP
jgi:GT2 family glycosyltransferase